MTSSRFSTTFTHRSCVTSPSGNAAHSLTCNSPPSPTTVTRASFSDSFMVGSFRKNLVTGISKPNRKGLAPHIGNDPKDDRIPIGPGDVSVDRAFVHGPVLLKLACRVLDFLVQPHEHHTQQIVGYVFAIGHALADSAGLLKQGFGFGLFHDSTVGRLACR